MSEQHQWSVAYRYCVMPDFLIGESRPIPPPAGMTVEHQDGGEAAIMEELQRLATSRHLGRLEFEDYTDEIHSFFRRRKKRVRFANLQYEGPLP